MAPSLTIARVCNLLLLLGLASAVPLESECRGTQDHILLSQFLRHSQSVGPVPRIYIPPGTGLPHYTPWALGSLFVASYKSQDYCGAILIRLHTDCHSNCEEFRIDF
jgi:hypothetical protein